MDDDLAALKARQEAEDRAYAEVLAELDRLATFALPLEARPEMPGQMERVNALWENPGPPPPAGLGGRFARRAWDAVAPALARHQEFHGALVTAWNAQFQESARVLAHLRELASALTRYAQRVEPTLDARDRVATALATTRAELILEAFDRRLESLARRLDGLLALRDRVETQGEELRAMKAALLPPPGPAAAAAEVARAADDAVYAAFENRFRGAEEVGERAASHVARLAGAAPVLDLGCGRGDFLAVLAQAGIEARGVDANARAIQEARARGLAVTEGDLLGALAAVPDRTLGAVTAIQVVEHLPPPVLLRLLAEAHRVLRGGGILLLETVNPRSVTGYLEVYLRDPTHVQALHPETLRFLAAAAGFTDVRIELRTPVEPAGRLQPVPGEDLPPRVVQVLNENVERLNGLLYGPQEYALVAVRG